MKCEICHQADAATVIHVKADNEQKELFVCKSCAAKSRHKSKSTTQRQRAEHIPEIETGPDGEPPEFVKNLLEATLGFMKGVAESTGKKTPAQCPACKTAWKTMKESGLIGCPHCWKVFAKKIRETFLNKEYGPKHIGTMPPSVTGEASRAFLERELKAAVAKEDFKKAAALKRKLDALGGGDGE